jgi:hypothetical protein
MNYINQGGFRASPINRELSDNDGSGGDDTNKCSKNHTKMRNYYT